MGGPAPDPPRMGLGTVFSVLTGRIPKDPRDLKPVPDSSPLRVKKGLMSVSQSLGDKKGPFNVRFLKIFHVMIVM